MDLTQLKKVPENLEQILKITYRDASGYEWLERVTGYYSFANTDSFHRKTCETPVSEIMESMWRICVGRTYCSLGIYSYAHRAFDLELYCLADDAAPYLLYFAAIPEVEEYFLGRCPNGPTLPFGGLKPGIYSVDVDILEI